MKKLWLSLLLLSFLAGVLSVSAQEMVEIRLVHVFGGENDSRGSVVQQLADTYMQAHPNISIVLDGSNGSYPDIFNNALLAADQGDAPNILQVEDALTQQAIDSGYFIPVGAVATEEQLATQETILPVIRAYYDLGDVVWSIPWNSSNPVFYYNKDMFRAAGLDPQDPPATFDEILAACEMIMNADLALEGCINWPISTWFLEQWVAMQNGLMVNNENGRSGRATETYFDSPEMLTIFEWIDALDDRGYFFYTGSVDDATGEAISFLGQRTAMSVQSTAGLTIFVNFAARQGFELGVSQMPLPTETATNGLVVGGASLWLLADQPEEELAAAVDFLFFLTSQENEILWHKGTGYIPNRQSTIDQLTAEGWFDENPFYRVAIEQLINSQVNTATAGAVIGPSDELRTFLEQAMVSVVDGNETPQAALQAAKDQADALLAEYNRLFE